jgi:pimeloyl-ACP methyl ester carboxylesterase
MNAPHPIAFRDTMGIAQLLRSYYIFVFQWPLAPEIWLTADNFSFLREAFLGKSKGVRRTGQYVLNESDVQLYQWCFSRAGTVTAAANYYRNIFGENVAYSREVGVSKSNIVAVPTLLVWGENDGALGKDSPAATHRYFSNLEIAMIPNASHWVQQDAVEDVIDRMSTYLHCKIIPLADLHNPPATMDATESNYKTASQKAHSSRKKH